MDVRQVSEKKEKKIAKAKTKQKKVKYLGLCFTTKPDTHGAVNTKQFIVIASLLLHVFLDFLKNVCTHICTYI